MSKQRKKKNDAEVKMRRKVLKPAKGEDNTKVTAPRTTVAKTHNFKKLDLDLVTIDEAGKIGFTAMYRSYDRVVVKEMKVRDYSKKESEQAKQGVVHKASVLADLAPFIWCMLITRSLLSRS